MAVSVTKLRAPGYETKIWIVVSASFKQACAFIEEKAGEPVMDKEDLLSTRALCFCPYDERGIPHVYLIFKPYANPGEIAHECNHAKNLIFQYHGTRLSLVNDEHESYFVGWLNERCWKSVQKHKKSLRKKRLFALELYP